MWCIAVWPKDFREKSRGELLNNRPVAEALFDESESEPTVSISLENLQFYKEIENWYNLGQ